MPERTTQPPDSNTPREQPPAGRGDASPEQGDTASEHRVPRMPHERDESASSQQAAEPSMRRTGEAARADTERGVADTTKGAELDATYEKVRGGEKKTFRP